MSKAVREYMELRTLHCARNTVVNDESVLHRFADWCGDVQVGGLSPEKVTRYFIDEVSPRNPSAMSYNKVLMRVRGFLGFCIARNWVRTNLMSDLKPKPVFRRQRLRLEADELQALLSYASNRRDRALLAIAMNTGFRASDLTALRVGDVDLVNGVIHMTNHKSRLEDAFPISLELDAELREWLYWYSDDVMSPLQRDWHLLPAREWRRWANRNGTTIAECGPWEPSRPVHRPAEVVKRVLLRTGITDVRYEGLHTIRRSVGRAFFEHASNLGHDAALRATASLLHHSSVTTTELYIGISADRQKRDAILQGQSFLGALAAQGKPVVKLERKAM
jgi:integrase